MKITESLLKQIIREELAQIAEAHLQMSNSAIANHSILPTTLRCLKVFLKRFRTIPDRKSLQRSLIKSVETGANGTQDYVVKKGPGKNKIATTRQ